MATVKPLRKMSAQIQSGSSYESGAMYLLPFVSGIPNQMFDPIADDSIVGTGFKAIPQQGNRHTFESTVDINMEKTSIQPILTAVFGTPTSNVYTLANQSNKLSVCTLNDLFAVQYANVYAKKLTIKGSSNSLWQMSLDFLGITAESRLAISNFPSVTDPDEPFTFHEAGGTSGYIRIGDITDALASGDDICIEDFNLDISTGYTGQWTNCGKGSLTPVWGAEAIELAGNFSVPHVATENYQSWAENNTPLQMEIYIYKSATATIKIQIPYFVISTELTDDDVMKASIKMQLGRNGVSSAINTNMNFTSPIKLTLVRS